MTAGVDGAVAAVLGLPMGVQQPSGRHIAQRGVARRSHPVRLGGAPVRGVGCSHSAPCDWPSALNWRFGASLKGELKKACRGTWGR